MNQNNIFKELIEKYPTWDELRLYLESDEGGLFKISDTNNDFSIIRYEKGITKMDLPHSKWFRSVVWNHTINRPVCIAPPKASNDVPKTVDGIVCQELLDGFMINCFKVDKTLHITTRSKLNAAGTFYSEKSFRELFMEAYSNTNNSPFYCESIIQDECNIRSPANGEISVFYSFLVQHKEHRIVKKINKNRVFIIHKGVVLEDGTVKIEDNPESHIETIPLDSIDSIHRILCEKLWDFQGVVLKDSLGNRVRFRSEKYNVVKALRGNTANIRDRFAQLFSQNLLFKYMEYYQDEIIPMNTYIMFINNIVKTLYDYYIFMHVKIMKIDIDRMFLPHLYNIHGIYLNQLRPNGKKVTVYDIMVYLQAQPWQRISFLIKKIQTGN